MQWKKTKNNGRPIAGASKGFLLRTLFSLVKNDRGVALILTIMAISIIVALSVQFNRKMRDQVISAAGVDHGLKALYIAKSGIAYALALLDRDERRVDTLMDSWSKDAEELKQLSAASSTLFPGGAFTIKIEDLSSKIQINQLVDMEGLNAVFKKFLENEVFDLDMDRIEEIADSVQDWLDTAGEEDDLTRASGAEDDYYMSLEDPYHCKNGPFDALEELLLVKGITPELFGKEGDDGKIRPYLSVFGDGKININTADVKVLQSLHEGITEGMAEEMDAYRKDSDETILENEVWYHDAGAGVPEDITIDKNLIATKSTHFRITSTGRFGDLSSTDTTDTAERTGSGSVQRTVVAVVERLGEDEEQGSEGFQVISWEIR